MSDTFSALGLMGVLETLWEWLIAAALTFWIGTLVIESAVLNGKEQRAAFFSYYRQRARPAQWNVLVRITKQRGKTTEGTRYECPF